MNTNRPDRATFLAFACRLAEDMDLVEHWPEALSRELDERGLAVVRQIHSEMQNETVTMLRTAMEADHVKRGLSPEMLANVPANRQFLDERAQDCASALTITRLKRWEDGKSSTDWNTAEGRKDEWHPRRETVAALMFGAYLATGAANRAEAADLLNRHAPRLRGALVEPGQIRDGVNRFGKDLADLALANEGTEIFKYRVRALTCLDQVQRVRAAVALWAGLHATKGRRGIANLVAELRQSGEIFARYQRAVAETPADWGEAAALEIHLRRPYEAGLRAKIEQAQDELARREELPSSSHGRNSPEPVAS